MFGLQGRTLEHTSQPVMIDPWFDLYPLLSVDSGGGVRTAKCGAADLYEIDDAVIVQVTVPGFKTEDISVQEQHGVLTIRADQRAERRGERNGVQFEAQRMNSVQRSFRLPSEVDASHAEATLRDGVLTIRLPKVQTSRARRITIQPSKQPITVHQRTANWLDRLTSWWRRPHVS